MLWTPPHLAPTYTITQATEQYQTFLCEFVDIKRNGFLHFTKAYNNLTYGFWGPVLKDADKYIENFAENLKLTIRLK